MKNERKLILYIAMSVDGYIAKPNDDLSFLSVVEREGEDYGYSQFLSEVDTVVLGRRTYDWVMRHVPAFPHENLETYVITRTPRPSVGSIQFYTGDLLSLIHELKSRQGKQIFCDGGATLVNSLLQYNLIDELILSVIPVLLGDGIKLFENGRPDQELTLKDFKYYDSGLVQLKYVR